jgi:hypothetical protein
MNTNTLFSFAIAAAATLLATGTSASGNAWQGAPKMQVGKSIAAYGWQDPGGGLHLRVTTPYRKNKVHRVTGSVCALDGQKMGNLRRVLLERVDVLRTGPKGHCLFFSFQTNGHMDGLDFSTGSKKMRFGIAIDGKHMPTSQIFVGPQGAHPASNPIVFKR